MAKEEITAAENHVLQPKCIYLWHSVLRMDPIPVMDLKKLLLSSNAQKYLIRPGGYSNISNPKGSWIFLALCKINVFAHGEERHKDKLQVA